MAEVHVGPVADELDIAGAGRDDFVPVGVGDAHGDRQDRAVRPAHRPDPIGIDQAAGDKTVHALFDVLDRIIIIVAAADRLHELEPVVRAAVIVRAQDERPALAQKLVRVGPALVPGIQVRARRAAVGGREERVFLAGLVFLRVEKDALDLLAQGAFPADDFRLSCDLVLEAGVEVRDLGRVGQPVSLETGPVPLRRQARRRMLENQGLGVKARRRSRKGSRCVRPRCRGASRRDPS